MQRRITGDMTPKRIGLSERGVQNKLPADRLAEDNALRGIGLIALFYEGHEFVAQEGLELVGTTPIVAFARLCRVICTAIIALFIRSATLRDSDNDCFGHFTTGVQISAVRCKQRKQATTIK